MLKKKNQWLHQAFSKHSKRLPAFGLGNALQQMKALLERLRAPPGQALRFCQKKLGLSLRKRKVGGFLRPQEILSKPRIYQCQTHHVANLAPKDPPEVRRKPRFVGQKCPKSVAMITPKHPVLFRNFSETLETSNDPNAAGAPRKSQCRCSRPVWSHGWCLRWEESNASTRLVLVGGGFLRVLFWKIQRIPKKAL